jgi:YfiH family protein
MISIDINQQQHWQFDSFNKIKSIKHLVTGRNPNIKRGDITGLNYGLNVSDNALIVENNRQEIQQLLHIQNGTVVIPVQTHTNNVAIVTDTNKASRFNDVDALITQVPNIIIGVLSADCVPILLVDPIKKVVACIHAGWKGTADNIVTNTIHEMNKHFDCKPSDIVAGIGPSISAQCYEVGDEVAIYFSENAKSLQTNGKSCIDLWKENQNQLLQAGLSKDNITISALCTYSNPDLFYSARRDGIKTGRMASFISIV